MLEVDRYYLYIALHLPTISVLLHGLVWSSILHKPPCFINPHYIKKVKSGVAQRIPGSLRFPDFVTKAHGGGRLSALRTGRLYP